jgi:hypothetical protein
MDNTPEEATVAAIYDVVGEDLKNNDAANTDERRERRADIRDQLAELEKDINAQWTARFSDFMEQQPIELMYLKAGHGIMQEACSLLHSRDIDVPSLYSTGNGDPPDEQTIMDISHIINHYLTVGTDFAKIMNVVHENPTLKSEWDRFCMFLRLAQD